MPSTYAQWLRYAAYTLLLVAVVVGGYYFFYVQQQTAQLANDRLALLRESSGYFSEDLGRVQENIKNTLKDSSKLRSLAKLDSALGEISGIPHASTRHWNEDSSRCLSAAKKYGKGHNQDVELYAKFEPSVSHPHLSFKLRHTKKEHTKEDTTYTCPLASANPDSLLIPLLPRSETAFDKVFLARRDGTVLVTSGSGSISIVRLPLQDRGPVDQQTTMDSNGTGGLYSEIFTMEAAGVSHRVFLQPFTVPIDITFPGEESTAEASTNDGDEVLSLAGIKKEKAFRAEAWKLPPTLLYILLGVVALALLAFPFLEVWLIGPTESFQAHDIFEVAVGVVIASSLVSLAVMSVFCENQLKQKKFEQLERLSKVIRNTVRTEVKAANQQLNHLTKLIRKCQGSCRQKTGIFSKAIAFDTVAIDDDGIRIGTVTVDTVTLDTLNVDSTALDRNEFFVDDDRTTVDTTVIDTTTVGDTLSYPHLEMASWINQNAMQVAKWSVEDQTTPLIDLF